MTGQTGHFTESEFVDLLDGAVLPARRAHLDSCAACATHAAELAASVAEAAQGEVPEPPPFFWTQFSGRVRDAVEREAAKPAWLRWPSARAPWLALATAAAVVVAVLVVSRVRSEVPSPAPAAIVVNHPAPPEFVSDEAIDLDTDEAWAVVRSLAADLDDDQMGDEGVTASSGAVEHLTLQLSDAERVELARLLQEQLRRGASPESAS